MLYKRFQEEPLSLTTIKLQWQLHGHILRLQNETTEVKAKTFDYKLFPLRISEEQQEKQLLPRCQTTLEERLQQHITLN